MRFKKHVAGFTLVEILIAIFIFAILSLIMTEGLSRMIAFHDATVKRAAELRELQFAFLMFSRDLEQVVNRSSVNAFGQKEPAFIGQPTEMTFTHAGGADSLSHGVEGQLQRVRYYNHGLQFNRQTFKALDQTANTPTTTRVLSNTMEEIRFQYYSRVNKRFYNDWPLKEATNQELPSAVRMYVTIPKLGKMSQLYVIEAGS